MLGGLNAEEVWWEQVTKKAKTADREVLGGLMVGLLGCWVVGLLGCWVEFGFMLAIDELR